MPTEWKSAELVGVDHLALLARHVVHQMAIVSTSTGLSAASSPRLNVSPVRTSTSSKASSGSAAGLIPTDSTRAGGWLLAGRDDGLPDAARGGDRGGSLEAGAEHAAANSAAEASCISVSHGRSLVPERDDRMSAGPG